MELMSTRICVISPVSNDLIWQSCSFLERSSKVSYLHVINLSIHLFLNLPGFSTFRCLDRILKSTHWTHTHFEAMGWGLIERKHYPPPNSVGSCHLHENSNIKETIKLNRKKWHLTVLFSNFGICTCGGINKMNELFWKYFVKNSPERNKEKRNDQPCRTTKALQLS